jgi:hypothetical protein
MQACRSVTHCEDQGTCSPERAVKRPSTRMPDTPNLFSHFLFESRACRWFDAAETPPRRRATLGIFQSNQLLPRTWGFKRSSVGEGKPFTPLYVEPIQQPQHYLAGGFGGNGTALCKAANNHLPFRLT